MRVRATMRTASCLGLAALAMVLLPAVAAGAGPVNTSLPSISGTAQDGETLRASPGAWAGPGPISYAYQWTRCDSSGAGCTNIAPATKASYKATSGDVGQTLRLVVSATNAGGSSSATSARTAKVAARVGKARWIFIASLLFFLLVIGFLLRGLLVGVDKRSSTSKTTAAVWTYLLASSLLSFVIAKFADDSRALDNLMHSGLAGQYGLLIGGPLGAAIAAKGIVGNQLSKNTAAKSGSADKPHLSQLIQNDAGEPDLGDFQYILFNFVAMFYFVGTLIESPTLGLPHIPDVLLGLTSVSAVGYVTKKALPPTVATAKISPATAKANTVVEITGKGLLVGEPPDSTPLIVLFGNVAGKVGERKKTGASETVKVTVPDGLTAGKAVDVVVITPSPARVNAGQFKLLADG